MLPSGVVNVFYINRNVNWNPDIALQAEGGSGSYTWRALSLPQWLLLDPATGVLSGKPNAAGTYSLNVQVTDAVTGDTTSKVLTLNVNAIEILDKGLNAGTVNRPYSDTLSAGGTPTSWSASGLPSGISLDSQTGILSGTPTLQAVGNHRVTVTVTDSTQATATSVLELSVNNLDEQWKQTIIANGERSKVVVDSSGNVYSLGTVYNEAGNNDLILYKFSSSGVQLWNATIDSGDDSIGGMVLDGNDNLYVLGNIYDFNTGAQDHQIIKYAASYDPGVPEGVQPVVTRAAVGVPANSIAVDNNGNVFVTATVHNGANYDIKVFKYAVSGQNWEYTYDGGYDEYDTGIAAKDGYLYVSGTLLKEDGYNFLVLKIDPSAPSGSELAWQPKIYKVAGEDNETYGIAVDGDGSVYVTGTSYAEGHDNDVLTIKYKANGDFDNEFYKGAYDRIGGSDRTEGIVLDGKGHIYVVGRSYYRTIYNRDYLIMKYDTSGNMLWTKTYDSLTGEDKAYGVAIDPNDNLYVTGSNYDAGTMTTIKYSPSDAP
jgi:hypothetical protein